MKISKNDPLYIFKKKNKNTSKILKKTGNIVCLTGITLMVAFGFGGATLYRSSAQKIKDLTVENGYVQVENMNKYLLDVQNKEKLDNFMAIDKNISKEEYVAYLKEKDNCQAGLFLGFGGIGAGLVGASGFALSMGVSIAEDKKDKKRLQLQPKRTYIYSDYECNAEIDIPVIESKTKEQNDENNRTK